MPHLLEKKREGTNLIEEKEIKIRGLIKEKR